MGTEAIVGVCGFAVLIISNVVMLSTHFGVMKQILESVVNRVNEHDKKFEAQGASIERLKSDVRLIAVESGASKYVQQIS